MKTIHKFPIELARRVTVEMDPAAKILHVGQQRGVLCIWAEVSVRAVKQSRTFAVRGTGFEFEDNDPINRHLGTVQMPDGFVWHVYGDGL